MREPLTPTTSGSLLRLRVAAGLDAGAEEDLPPRLRRLLEVARDVGAPVGDAIDAGLEAEEDRQRAERAVTVASSQTKVVAGGLLLAPLVLVPSLGRLLGADLLGFYTHGFGILVLVVGIGLLLGGAGFIALLLRRVARAAEPRARSRPRWLLGAAVGAFVWWLTIPALGLPVGLITALATRPSPEEGGSAAVEEAAELIATAHAGGVTSPQAIRLAARQLPELRGALHRLAFDLELQVQPSASADRVGTRPSEAPHDPLARLRAVLVAAEGFGAPVAPTLRRLAAELRADDLARVLAAAERLPAQLTFPTALCLLPGTVLLVGAPIVQAGLAGVGT